MLLSSYYLYKGKIRIKIAKKIGQDNFSKKLVHYAGRHLLQDDEVNECIYKAVLNEKPFMICRFGSTELSSVSTFHFKVKKEYENAIRHVCFYSGFFPEEVKYGHQFADVMINAITNTDLLAVWFFPYEDYYIKKYLPVQSQIGYLMNIEPWRFEKPWTRALKGKKVLVIHPFEESIKRQYAIREKLFDNPDILPEFELKTLKAVQTLAGEKEDRFKTWFEALNYMYTEAMKIDFDIAIIGCGAYGMPLASMLKEAGKKAIHMGGVTQILFGIKGKRWEEEPAYNYIKKLMNENWIYPLETEKPKGSQHIEGNCYWG